MRGGGRGASTGNRAGNKRAPALRETEKRQARGTRSSFVVEIQKEYWEKERERERKKEKGRKTGPFSQVVFIVLVRGEVFLGDVDAAIVRGRGSFRRFLHLAGILPLRFLSLVFFNSLDVLLVVRR